MWDETTFGSLFYHTQKEVVVCSRAIVGVETVEFQKQVPQGQHGLVRERKADEKAMESSLRGLLWTTKQRKACKAYGCEGKHAAKMLNFLDGMGHS